MHPTALSYWSSYGKIHFPEALPAVNDEKTGVCFPGRPALRPGIRFEHGESVTCNKFYPTSKRFTNGVLTVQCCCPYPKLLGFVILQQPESTAMALTSILTHFSIPPANIFYDNGCNLYASTVLRTPWLLHLSNIYVDRFHYRTHKCASLFDASTYLHLDSCHTSSAESFNSRLKSVIGFVRYLKGTNYMTFLRARFAMLNLAVMFRSQLNKPDLEDHTLQNFFAETIECRCHLCSCKNCEE